MDNQQTRQEMQFISRAITANDGSQWRVMGNANAFVWQCRHTTPSVSKSVEEGEGWREVFKAVPTDVLIEAAGMDAADFKRVNEHTVSETMVE